MAKDHGSMKPRKYQTPFNMFLRAVRQKYKDENPEVNNMKLLCMISKTWGNMVIKERQPYIDESDADRDRFF